MALLSHYLQFATHGNLAPSRRSRAIGCQGGTPGITWYNARMSTETLKDLVQHADSWPQEDQEELANYARVIEARRTGLYLVSEAERIALAASIKEANQGEFVPEAELAAARKSRSL